MEKLGIKHYMRREILTLAVIEVILITSGFFIAYYGTERREGTKITEEFSFGTYHEIDYTTNKTYQGAGSANIYQIPYGDIIEILPIQTPNNFNGSIGNFYYLVWDGGEKANLPANKPTKMIRASELPQDYIPSNIQVSFEFVANNDNATWNSIVSSNEFSWYGNFVLYHTVSANPILFTLGVVVVICGLVSTLLTTRLLRPMKQKKI